MTPKLFRHPKNPILTPTKNSWENKWVFNCGAAIHNGKVVLLYRAQGNDDISRFGLAVLEDGVRVQERSKNHVMGPDSDSEYESHGVEDPRITQIGETYYILYTAASLYPPLVPRPEEGRLPGDIPWRVRVSLAHTADFQKFVRHGVIISHIDSKDATLFPEQINKNYVLLHRVYPQMRLAVAPTLHEFHERGVKERGVYIWPREGKWDSERVGAGAPPIKTPYGWLLFYHGVNHDLVYRLGILLADLVDPSKILIRTDESILEPQKTYERKGQTPNVVFTCGAVEWHNHFLVYYGAADSVIGMAYIEKENLFRWIEGKLKEKRPSRSLSAIPER